MRLRELSQTRQALGGDVSIGIVSDASQKHIEDILNGLWREIFSFERQFSRFLPMSELSVFNRLAGTKTTISPGFKKLLMAAKELSAATNGLFNPFILPALQRAGYIKSAAIGYENDVQEDHTKKHVSSVDHLQIGKDWASIPYGSAIDLGGCGKGYLADLISKYLNRPYIKGFWLSLGGDIATYGLDRDGKNFTLAIQDASNLSEVSDWYINCPAHYSAVATSGTFRRQGQDGKNWHHIIDPVSLKPAHTDIRLATVCAATALEADVLASCAVILGSLKAPAFLRKHSVKSMLLQGTDETGNGFTRHYGKIIQSSARPKLEVVR